MELDDIRAYCLGKPGASESLPFGPDALVFKVMDKMFALCALDDVPLTINLKCDPAYAEELRAQHHDITPGWHMNKKHWNTINVQGDLPDSLVRSLIDHSYEAVVKSMTKAGREKLLQVTQ